MSKEILNVVEAFSNEKGVTKDQVFAAIEFALATATKKTYDEAVDISVEIDRHTGEYTTYRQWLVMDDEDPEFESPDSQLLFSYAQNIDNNLTVGDYRKEEVESIDFGRIGAQTARQIIKQKIREAERLLIVEEYTPRVGELMTALVKRVERGNLVLDFGEHTEGLLPKRDQIIHDDFKVGDRVRAVLREVTFSPRGPQLFLTRTSNHMLLELMKIEVPEIGDEVIDVMAIARDAGFRAKVAVRANDKRLDPIGACIGMRGSRIMAVSNELANERVDIILWDENPPQFVINAMAPAEIVSITVDEDKHLMDLAVTDDMLSQAIGKNGQNIQLASALTAWELNVMSQSDMQQKQQDETQQFINLFMSQLDIDDELATILVEEGFSTIDEVAYVPAAEMLEIDGFDDALINELKIRAKDAILTNALAAEEEVEIHQPQDDLLALEGMSQELAMILASKNICSQEDLAELGLDELQEITENRIELNETQASQLILAARAPWFE